MTAAQSYTAMTSPSSHTLPHSVELGYEGGSAALALLWDQVKFERNGRSRSPRVGKDSNTSKEQKQPSPIQPIPARPNQSIHMSDDDGFTNFVSAPAGILSPGCSIGSFSFSPQPALSSEAPQSSPVRIAEAQIEAQSAVQSAEKERRGWDEKERRGWDVRIAWRDAELFYISKREQRWLSSLSVLHWKTTTRSSQTQNLRLSRFAERKRQADARSKLLAWWAAVMLKEKSICHSPVADSACYSDEESTAHYGDGGSVGGTPRGFGSKLRAIRRHSSDKLLAEYAEYQVNEEAVERALTLCRLTGDSMAKDILTQHCNITRAQASTSTVGLSFDDKSGVNMIFDEKLGRFYALSGSLTSFAFSMSLSGLVSAVLVGGPAFNSKRIFKGDQIIAVDGNATSPQHILSALKGLDTPGSLVILTLKRTSVGRDKIHKRVCVCVKNTLNHTSA